MKYRDIPAADGGDADMTIESFELETPHYVRRNRNHGTSGRRKCYCIALSCFALLVLVAGYRTYFGGGNGSDDENSSSPDPSSSDMPWPKVKTEADKDLASLNQPSSKEKEKDNYKVDAKSFPQEMPKMVYCYGDSLTYGVSPPAKEQYPYAQYLMDELNLLYNPDFLTSLEEVPESIVQYTGLPGWTAQEMVERIEAGGRVGMCDIIKGKPYLSLMIILAGTNDIGWSEEKIDDINPKHVLESIAGLHNGAIGCAKNVGNTRLHTLAIGIPGSQFQASSQAASKVSAEINDGLKQFATAYPGGKITYIDFPLPYERGTKWSVDGVHLTEEGYKELGKVLAIEVKAILDKMDVQYEGDG